jgi:predicted extracellular nuclease
MNKKNIYLILLLFVYFPISVKSQPEKKIKRDFRIMFYNVENLFDIENDSLTNDDEFTEQGERHWNSTKYYDKLNKIAKVIIALGEWSAPDIVGVCEIENRHVLEGLTRFSPLKAIKYKIIHQDSPDKRGIDVGFLYRPDKFSPIDYYAIPINFPNVPEHKTRDILHVIGTTNYSDTLNIFINHWPSRWGGQLESEESRIYVASVLRTKVDSIFTNSQTPNIIIMGDLNDYPENISISKTLKANIQYSNPVKNELYNLSWNLQENKKIGSHKYAGEWGILDQIIVSGNFLIPENKVVTTIEDAHIFNNSFLLEPDKSNVGFKPFRTYIGFKYNDGYSDHLPVYLDLYFKK